MAGEQHRRAGLQARQSAAGVVISIKVKPKAARTRVLGVREGALEVSIAAPPVDGQANAELTRTLARFFDVSKTSVRLVAGQSGRNKRVELVGLDLSELERRLNQGE